MLRRKNDSTLTYTKRKIYLFLHLYEFVERNARAVSLIIIIIINYTTGFISMPITKTAIQKAHTN